MANNNSSEVSNYNRKWTNTEDALLLRTVRAFPQNLHKCFVMVSEQLTEAGTPRTPTAVQAHWYAVLSRKQEAKCFFTASPKHVSMNRKNGMGVESNGSIWRRLMRIIDTVIG